jgi:SAM-dependent methyltransferase
LTAQDREAVASLGRRLGLERRVTDGWCRYYGWKIALAPRSARRILDLGCASGHECVVMRGLFPEAEIDACDYRIAIPDAWQAALELRSVARPIGDFLAEGDRRYDLVFSNHTLEHMADPIGVLARIRERLQPGGTLVSAVPLEADSTNPFYREVLESAEASRSIHPLDLEPWSLCHFWKTNPADLHAALASVGFSEIRFYFRSQYPSGWRNEDPMHRNSFERWRRLAALLEGVTLAPARRALKALFRERPPAWLTRRYYQVAGHLWFSKARMLIMLQNEIVFSARRGA